MHHMWMTKAAAALFGADMVLKQYVEETMESGKEKNIGNTKVVLRKVYNKGFLLNLMDEQPKLVKNVSVVIGLGVLAEDIRLLLKERHWLEKAGMTFTSAGAASNIFDRLVRGRVVDYIGYQVKNPFLSKVTANLGDFYIAAGMIFVVLGKIFERKKVT